MNVLWDFLSDFSGAKRWTSMIYGESQWITVPYSTHAVFAGK